MSEWVKTTLGEVLSVTHRLVNVESLEEVPWAGARWYAGGIYSRLVEPASKVKTKTLNRLEAGDVTYNRMWATKAAFGVVNAEADGCLVTGDFPIFVADQSRLLPEYMREIFQTDSFQREASQRAVGTTERRRLKELDFLSIHVSLPSLAEQRRIVDVIAAVDAQIEASNEEAQRLRLVLALTRDDFPEGHERAVSDIVLGIDSGRSAQTTDELPLLGEPAVLKLSAVQLGAFVPGEAKRLDDLTGYTDVHMVGEGDLLITRASGSLDRVGYAAIASGVRPRTYMPDLIWRVRVDPDQCSTAFLGHLLSAPAVRTQLTSAARGSASMRKINKALLGALRLSIPTLDKQAAYVKRCDGLAASGAAVLAELACLRVFRSTLLTALLNQDVEIPEFYDAAVATSLGVAS